MIELLDDYFDAFATPIDEARAEFFKFIATACWRSSRPGRR